MAKKKLVVGPQKQPQTNTQEAVETEAKTEVEITTAQEAVDESVYHTVDEKIDQEQLDYKLYAPTGPTQHKIPFKYKIWFFAVLIIACICGYHLATSNTTIPVEVIPVSIQVLADGNSVLVELKDLEHIQVDVFKDNKEIKPSVVPTVTGFLYSNLEPGEYIFHTTEVQHSNIKYGVKSVTINAELSYDNITEAVISLVSKIPDEGNKKELCELLSGNFATAANKVGDVDTISSALREENAVTLGFTGRPKLPDESVWYDLLKKNGGIYNYIKSNGITIDAANYKQIFTAIAKGFKEAN